MQRWGWPVVGHYSNCHANPLPCPVSISGTQHNDDNIRLFSIKKWQWAMFGRIKDFWCGHESFPKAASMVAAHFNTVPSWRHNCYIVRRNEIPSLYRPILNFVFRRVQEQTTTCICSLGATHTAALLWLTTFSKKHTQSVIQINFSLYGTIRFTMREIQTKFSYALLPTSNCKNSERKQCTSIK